MFYWLPGGGVEAGETVAEALRRELLEEASLRVEVGRLLYISENLFVESGDYRHELILYLRPRSSAAIRLRRSTREITSGTPPTTRRDRSYRRRWRRR